MLDLLYTAGQAVYIVTAVSLITWAIKEFLFTVRGEED
jgi:hypothetical protein